MKLSFCIPSLNRPEYLCQTIKSICSNEKHSSEFEVIVYNNFSDIPYTIVEETINRLSLNYNINYRVGTSRLDIDRSMFEAIRYSKGDYLFFIGDDDFLLEDGIQSIFDLIEKTDFDLAVFNAILINGTENTKKELIGYSGRTYNQLDLALMELKIYCAYSNILIKSRYYIESDFKYLIGSSHAYGSYWFAFFREFEKDINPIIIVPKEHVVCMRAVVKNYKILDVIYKDIDIEFKLYYAVIGEKSKKVLKKFEENYWKQHSSLKELVYYAYYKYDLRSIKQLNPLFYKKYLIKIQLSMIIAAIIIPVLKPVRDQFRKTN
ncbi:MAG: glycosyltransferase family 2 protein [Paludibacter sp.]|nr:glycosyltransferase family 2 protein [Paludibacter sp.]